jgi:gas vesicle structural protein
MSGSSHIDEGNLVLSDLINRVLDTGVVISGHVTISIADIDLLELDLKLLLTSIETAAQKQLRIAQSPSADVNAPVLPPSGGK